MYIEANKSAANAAMNDGAAAADSNENSVGSKDQWYKGSVKYWDAQPATVDGVLGGFEEIHIVESDTSKNMIQTFKHMLPSMGSALDCGAGIGRITKTVLKPMFENVDLVEPSKTQIDEAKNYVP